MHNVRQRPGYGHRFTRPSSWSDLPVSVLVHDEESAQGARDGDCADRAVLDGLQGSFLLAVPRRVAGLVAGPTSAIGDGHWRLRAYPGLMLLAAVGALSRAPLGLLSRGVATCCSLSTGRHVRLLSLSSLVALERGDEILYVPVTVEAHLGALVLWLLLGGGLLVYSMDRPGWPLDCHQPRRDVDNQVAELAEADILVLGVPQEVRLDLLRQDVEHVVLHLLVRGLYAASQDVLLDGVLELGDAVLDLLQRLQRLELVSLHVPP